MISVIIPVYNVTSYLDACLTSIVNQTYKDLEIIVVDDGSTDGSGNKCDEWARKDNRIKVIHKENGGLSDARNVGMQMVSGEYLAFIDSDDEVALNYFEYLYDLLIEFNTEISVCGYKTIDENGYTLKEMGDNIKPFKTKGPEESLEIYLDNRGINVAVWGKLYKFTLFKENLITFPLGKYNEDVFVTYLILDAANSVAIGSERLYFYRIRQGSIMRNDFCIKQLNTLEGRKLQQSFIENKYPKLTIKSINQIYGDLIRIYQMILKSKENKIYHLSLLNPYFDKYNLHIPKINRSLKFKVYTYIITLHSKLAYLLNYRK